MKKSFLLLLLLLLISFSYAQTDTCSSFADTTKTGNKIKNPKLAIVLSSVLPGAGQVYNGKFWKVPIVYAGLYTSYYFLSEFNTDYKVYRNDILLVQDTANHNVITISGFTDLDELKGKYNEYRRKRDLAFIGGVLVWGLNVIDAYIDAELSDFDVSEDLSIRVKPSINYFNTYNPNLSLTVQFYFK